MVDLRRMRILIGIENRMKEKRLRALSAAAKVTTLSPGCRTVVVTKVVLSRVP